MLTTHRLAIVLLLATVCIRPSHGQESNPARPIRDARTVEILRKADAATRACKLVTYEARVTASGWLAAFMGSVEGNVVIEGWSGNRVEKFRYNVDVRHAGAEDAVKLSAGHDADSYYLIDHQAKTVETGNSLSVFGDYARSVLRVAMREFVLPAPFSDELRGHGTDLRKDTTVVAGVRCHVIHVTYADGETEATWYFATKDHLPRRVDRLVSNPSGGAKGAITLVLKGLTVNPVFVASPFKLRIPNGYTKTAERADR